MPGHFSPRCMFLLGSTLALAIASPARTEPPSPAQAQMRDHAATIPQLGVPKYDWWNEGLHGVAFGGYATNFPQVIGMAATWDTDLVHRMAEVVSTEARAKYHQAMREDHHEMFFGLTFWAPNVNIFRDPRWGRGQETYGEDPFLTGRMAVAFV